MIRLLTAFGAFAMTGSVALSIAAPSAAVEVVGEDQPLFLGSSVVSASALPDR